MFANERVTYKCNRMRLPVQRISEVCDYGSQSLSGLVSGGMGMVAKLLDIY